MSKKTTQRARIATLEEHAAERRAQPPRKPEPPLKGRTLTNAEYEARAKKASKRKLPSERLGVPATTPDVDAKVVAAEKAPKTHDVALKDQKATTDAVVQTKRATGERGAPQCQSMSLLDAAATILSVRNGLPMRCKDIVELAVKRDLWTPRAGKTPAATLYAAILREIASKGEASRFVKNERGLFAHRRV